jgi:hypothetical protein
VSAALPLTGRGSCYDGTGFTPETIITKANAANLATPSRWPKTVAHGLLGAPAIANNLVYYGDKNGTVYA